MSRGIFSSISSIGRRSPSGLLIASFGLILTAAAWLDVLHRQSADREAEIERIHRENSGLAHALEEHVRRVVQTADNALLFLQHEYETSGRVTAVIVNFVERTKRDPILNQIALADAGGDLLLSAVQHDRPINIARREHFQVHATGGAAGLFIGKPVLTQASGTWSFFLSRRLSRPDGSFSGVVSIGLNPTYFSDYYDNPELGPDRAVVLVGRDGIVRARRFQRQSEVGQNLRGSPMFKRIDRAATGHYEVTGVIDSLNRFVSYRALPDLPLIVAVSDLTSSALAPFRRRAAEFRLSALIFTLFVAIFCLVLIRAERRIRHDNASLTAELTERSKAEEALSESQGLFSAFLDHIPAVVFVQDLEGRILYSNQAFKDLPGRGAIGGNARDLLAPGQDGHPGNRPALRGRSVVLDETIDGVDGQTRIFETRMFVVDRAGKEPLLGCISVDSTGRRHSEEERLVFERRMQQSQKLESLGVLAGGIAHDFNNLLMVILGNADLALSKSAPESPVRGFIINIDMAAQRAADLANQMLAYSGKGRFLIEPINLSRLVEEMGHLLASVISKRAAVRYRLARDLPSVQADATQIRQVVMNLITNAADAIGEREGVISVATGIVEIAAPKTEPRSSGPPLPQGTYAFLEVADTGSGMDPATRARIFDPFYTTKQTGRGLGLASVLGIIRGHHGEIQVSSTPGQGTTFTVLLPTAPGMAPAGAAAAGAPAPEPGSAENRRVILLVDDEEHVRRTTQDMLEESGFTVVTAADGAEGVEVFRSQAARLSAVVLDMNMPRMDGAEAFRRMRQIAPAVPVILTSGLDEQDAVGEFTAAGLAGFIQKPYRMKALLRKIEAAIAAGAAPPA
jgi:nitrogen-specific signal transduction histidine kinase/ActR/RegA family two-component response regulator